MNSKEQFPDVPDELIELLAALTEGKLMPQQQQQLSDLLQDDPLAQQFYLNYLSTHSLLRLELGGHHESFIDVRDPNNKAEDSEQANGVAELLEEAEQVEARRSAELAAEQSRQAAEAAERRRKMQEIADRKANRRPEPIVIPNAVSYAVVAALAATLLFVVTRLDLLQFEPAPQPTATATPRPVQVATLGESASAKWKSVEFSTAPGTSLPAGVLELVAGVVEIKFDGGARMLVEAPAEFELMTPASAKLNHGRLVGFVSPDSTDLGLTIETAAAKIVDLGTEFGVSVPLGDEPTDVHVFQGAVEMQSQPSSSPESKRQELLRLEAGSSASADSAGTITRLANLNSDRFVRQMSEAQKNHFPNGPLPDRLVPVTHDLVLWLAADGIVKKDSRGLVSVWGDLCAGDNSEADNAEQQQIGKQPRWVAKGIGSKPAIVFDGWNTSLVTKPFQTTDEQTLFVVVQSDIQQVIRLAKQQRTANVIQIVNYHGPPNIVLEWSSKGTLQGRNWVPDGTDAQLSVGWAESPAHQTSDAVVCSYVYSTLGKQARLYENGKQVSAKAALGPAAINSSKFIGAHYLDNRHFIGKMAELLIYNAVLSEEEISTISQYLAEKYQITTK